jgi:hypothetical protein
VLLFFSVLLPFVDDVPYLPFVLLAVVSVFFEAFYAGLWKGQLPWMERRAALWSALLWTLALWVLAVGILAPLTRALYQEGRIEVTHGIGDNGAGAVAVSWDFAVLYIWHALDAIPGFEITKTLRWNEPIGHDRAALGVLLVGYRAAVLIPLIATVGGLWKTRQALAATKLEAPPPVSPTGTSGV